MGADFNYFDDQDQDENENTSVVVIFYLCIVALGFFVWKSVHIIQNLITNK